MTEAARTSILFICLGNICRSPLAEGIFLHKIHRRDQAARFHVDSAGTGAWHVGERADARMRRVAAARGVELISRARQVTTSDFRTFDHLVCMDEANRDTILRRGAPTQRVRLLLDACPHLPLREVPDPYYGGDEGFETVFDLVDQACDALLDELLAAAT